MNTPTFSKEKTAAFFVGLFAPFAVSLVGEMPIGEIVLLGVFAWLCLHVVLEHRWPGRLMDNPLLRWMLVCQGIATLGYVIADVSWQSTPHDMVRGWARMVFLAIDLVTIGYLFAVEGRDALVRMQWGTVVGGMIYPLLYRPMFADYWKFGFGAPISVAVLLLLPRMGRNLGILAVLGVSALHFALNFRSMGGSFLVVGVLMMLQNMPLRLRALMVPLSLLMAAGALTFIANRSASANRSHDLRSDISRKAMLTAALHGIRDHPFIGNGSWFGKSTVMDDFLELRYQTAQEEHLGGIGRENNLSGDEEQPYALHSQLLVALAEGGILGGAFFILYGGMLLWGLGYYILFRPWTPYSGLYLFLLLGALFNLFMSPFSGVHRVYIATASGLLLIVWREYSQQKTRVARPALAPRWHLPPKARVTTLPV